MTASNQTYTLLSSNPGTGTGTPHEMSLVIGRSTSPSLSTFVVNARTCAFQCALDSTNLRISSVKWDSFRK
jgi:hypothetical protein